MCFNVVLLDFLEYLVDGCVGDCVDWLVVVQEFVVFCVWLEWDVDEYCNVWVFDFVVFYD